MAVRPLLPFSSEPLSVGLKNGPSPVILKTDGACLILKGVRFSDGKRYDVRIWKWNEDGSEFKFDGEMKFFSSEIAQIQQITASIFSQCKDPSKSTFFYQDNPEQCFSKGIDGNQIDLIQAGQTEIVDGARRIHQLLMPKIGFAYTSNPNEKLVIQPQALSQSEIDQMNPAPVATQNDSLEPQISSNLKETVDVSTGTDPDLETVIEPQMEEVFNDVAKKFLNPTLFKEVSYSEFATYSKQNPKSPQDKLFPAYQAYLEVVKNPATDSEDSKEVKRWLEQLYRSAYEKHKGSLDFNQERKVKFKNADDCYKYYAASSVVGFIKVDGLSINELTDYLLNISVDN